MYTSIYVNTTGTLKVIATYQKRYLTYQETIAEVCVDAEDISKRYQEIVDQHFGNCDKNPIAYDFIFSTLH